MEDIDKLDEEEMRILAGVCGEIGKYFNIDPLVVRILAIIIPGIRMGDILDMRHTYAVGILMNMLYA